MNPDTLALLQAGKLEQACPVCGTREAAGYYCSKCSRPTGPDDWRPTARSDAQMAASRANARTRAENLATSKKTAIPATVAGQS